MLLIIVTIKLQATQQPHLGTKIQNMHEMNDEDLKYICHDICSQCEKKSHIKVF